MIGLNIERLGGHARAPDGKLPYLTSNLAAEASRSRPTVGPHLHYLKPMPGYFLETPRLTAILQGVCLVLDIGHGR